MAHKEMNYIKGWAKGRGYFQLLKAINCATLLHEGQFRKGGEPYINHPMRVCSSLIALGVTDEVILASAILHDTTEDCQVGIDDLQRDYQISQKILNVVYILDKSNYDTIQYYYRLSLSAEAMIVKLSDRCHNISTMVGAFSEEKIQYYIKETEEYVFPMIKHLIKYHPEYSDVAYSMKYHIESIIDALKVTNDLQS